MRNAYSFKKILDYHQKLSKYLQSSDLPYYWYSHNTVSVGDSTIYITEFGYKLRTGDSQKMTPSAEKLFKIIEEKND